MHKTQRKKEVYMSLREKSFHRVGTEVHIASILMFQLDFG